MLQLQRATIGHSRNREEKAARQDNVYYWSYCLKKYNNKRAVNCHIESFEGSKRPTLPETSSSREAVSVSYRTAGRLLFQPSWFLHTSKVSSAASVPGSGVDGGSFPRQPIICIFVWTRTARPRILLPARGSFHPFLPLPRQYVKFRNRRLSHPGGECRLYFFRVFSIRPRALAGSRGNLPSLPPLLHPLREFHYVYSVYRDIPATKSHFAFLLVLRR